MPLWDRKKKREPTPEEQAKWEELASAERNKRKAQRQRELTGRVDSKDRMLDQMRRQR